MNLREQIRAVERKHSGHAPPRRLQPNTATRPGEVRFEPDPDALPEILSEADLQAGQSRPVRGPAVTDILSGAGLRACHSPDAELSGYISSDAKVRRCEASDAEVQGYDAAPPEADEAFLADESVAIKSPPSARLQTGWPVIDAELGGGLVRGALHEWFGLVPPAHAPRGAPWLPPLSILTHLAWCGLDACDAPRCFAWIGTACFPYPRLLLRGAACDARLLTRSIFVAPPDAPGRLWAIDLALRCPAVAGVLADGSEFDRVATQRLQFLADTRDKWVLLARPPNEAGKLSAAHTRWFVHWSPPRAAGSVVQPCWSLELWRCRGWMGTPRRWELEWSHARSRLDLSAAVVDPAGAAHERRPALARRGAAG